MAHSDSAWSDPSATDHALSLIPSLVRCCTPLFAWSLPYRNRPVQIPPTQRSQISKACGGSTPPWVQIPPPPPLTSTNARYPQGDDRAFVVLKMTRSSPQTLPTCRPHHGPGIRESVEFKSVIPDSHFGDLIAALNAPGRDPASTAPRTAACSSGPGNESDRVLFPTRGPPPPGPQDRPDSSGDGEPSNRPGPRRGTG
jgi:hypothetical protein